MTANSRTTDNGSQTTGDGLQTTGTGNQAPETMNGGAGTNNQAPSAQSPAPNSQLPSGVQAAQALDRKKLMRDAQELLDKSDSQKSAGGLQALWKNNKKLILIVGAVMLLLLCAILLLPAGSGPSQSITFSGEVLSTTGRTIPDASVDLGEEYQSLTDEQGQFSISDIPAGDYTVRITAEGYQQLEQSVAITDNNDSNTRSYTLEPLGSGAFTGSFIAPDNEDYRFADDKLLVADKEYRIEIDGTFSISDLDTGVYTLQYTSPNYQDFTLENLQLEPGDNLLEPVELTPAGDIVGTIRSFLREEMVWDAELSLEGVPENQFELDDEGNFRFVDLEVGETYKLRASAPNYNARDYDITVSQGENPLVNFSIVEAGRVAFLNKVESTTHLFTADLDGENVTQITEDRLYPFGLNIVDSGQYVAFASGQGGKTHFYSAPADGSGNPQQLTSTVEDELLRSVYPNYVAEKFSAESTDPDARGQKLLTVVDFAGSSTEVISTTGEYIDPRISDSGRYITFLLNNPGKSDHGLHLYDLDTDSDKIVSTDEVVAIYDISSSGGRVIFGVYDATANRTGLRMYDSTSGTTRTLMPTADGQFYQFITGNENELLFTAQREGKSNIFLYLIDSATEQRLTTAGGVESLYQQGSVIVYYSPEGMYVMDPQLPEPDKLVTSDVMRYTGYEY